MREGGWFDLLTVDLFWPYAIFFWAVLLLRIYLMKVTRTEWLVLALLVGHHLLEVVQLMLGSESLTITMLPHRYFATLAPLVWGWTAYGLVQLWQVPHPRWKYLTRLIALAVFVHTITYVGIVKFQKEYKRGVGRDAMVAAQAIAPFILEDYKGPKVTPDFPYTVGEYYTNRRPVIDGPYAAAAWCVRGQGIMQETCPFPLEEDYAFFRADQRPERLLDKERYQLLKEVKGLRNTTWQLYKRIDAE